MMGESPTRPGSFHASPLVVVQPDMSPLSFSAEQWMVPVGGKITSRMADARWSGAMPSSAATSSIRFIRICHSSFCDFPAGKRFFPVGICESRTPPVGMSFFPQQPNLARIIGQQIFARKTLSHGETFSAFSYQHDVPGMLHDCLGYLRRILNVADTTNRASSPGRSVHET